MRPISATVSRVQHAGLERADRDGRPWRAIRSVTTMSSAPRLVACTMRPACAAAASRSTASGVRDALVVAGRGAGVERDGAHRARLRRSPRGARTAAASRSRRPGSAPGRSPSARSAAAATWSARSTHGVEAGALQQRHHVDQHLAGGAHLAAEAVARAQQVGLAVGAAVDPLRKLQRDQRRRGSSSASCSMSASLGKITPTGMPAGQAPRTACHCA